MKRFAARVLIVIGAALVALGKRIEGAPTTAKVITLQPGKHYRRIDHARPGPDRWEVTRLGLGILFSSLTYGLVGV